MSLLAVVNQSIAIPFTVLDSNGDPETGLSSFTKSAYLVSTPATTASPTVTENANGTYRIAFTPTTTGIWHCTWSCSVDGETVRYEETVQVVTAAQFDPAAYLASQNLTIATPEPDAGDFTIYQGDSYASSESRQLVWNLTGAPDLTGATVTFRMASRNVSLSKTATITNAGQSTQTATIQLTSSESDDWDGRELVTYDLAATLANGNHVTLARGRVTVRAEIP